MDEIDKINRAFTPAHEIREPTHFVGRHDEVKAAILALPVDGAFLAVWGPRGVGKSSFARQIQLLASGDNILAEVIGERKLVPKEGFQYIVQYVACDRTSIRTTTDLIGRIINGDAQAKPLGAYLKDGDKPAGKREKTSTIKSNLGVYSGEISEKFIPETEQPKEKTQQFMGLLRDVREHNRSSKQGLLIVVDEFDQLADKTGFASLVKTCSNDFVKFCVVGIASDLTTLLGDHASIARQLNSIALRRMSRPELLAIIDRANTDLSPRTVQKPLAEEIVQLSEGFPYFVHLLGRECTLESLSAGDKEVGLAHLEVVLAKLRSGTLSHIYEQAYNIAVKHSPQRELLLKAFANEVSDEIETGGVYEFVKGLGVTNPSQLMKELTSPEGFEPFLLPVRDRCYGFADPVFRTYVKIRNPKFGGSP